jgi:hypothetical protein
MKNNEPDVCECNEVYEQKVGDKWLCASCKKPFSNEKKLIHAKGERYCGKPILGKEKDIMEKSCERIFRKLTPKPEHKEIEELKQPEKGGLICERYWIESIIDKINELVKRCNRIDK